MKDIANEFRNYQAFVLHYQPVVILKVGRMIMPPITAGRSQRTRSREGPGEYIEGWLYGAVQVARGQVRKKEGPR